MNDHGYLSEQQLAYAKRYIETNAWNLPEFEGVHITSNGETKFTYKRIGIFFTKITVTYAVYEKDKPHLQHLAPNTVAICNSQLKAYAEAHERHLLDKQLEFDFDEIKNLLAQNPSQIASTLQFIRSNLMRSQMIQRGTSDSSVTPNPTLHTKRR